MARGQHTGEKYGSWTVETYSHCNSKRTKYYWLCKCDCGYTKKQDIHYLKQQINPKCRKCANKERIASDSKYYHGKSKSKVWLAWRSMKDRCNNSSHASYEYYKDVQICERWHKFINFLEDMGEPMDFQTLDRINPELGYFKENCRWATWEVQAHNRKKSGGKTSYYKGVSYSAKARKWRVQIRQGGKYMYLGGYTCEYDAAVIYDDASERLYGDRPNET